MSKQRLVYEPIHTIISAVGGPDEAARICGVTTSAVYRWMRSRESGGTDGDVDIRHLRAIYRHACALQIALPAELILREPIATAVEASAVAA